MPGNLYKRPMFRKGGSAEGGITSGLQAPRQGYDNGKSVQPLNMDQNMAEFLRNASIGDMKAAADQMYTPKERPNYAKRRLGDLMIDFGIDIASRTPTGSGISGAISTALAAAKDPFERFKASRGNEELLMQQQAENLDERRAGMFKSLIEGQSDILAEKSGSGRFRDEAAAIELRRIIPRLTELKEKRKNQTLAQGEDVELLQLQEEFNLYRKKDVGQEVLIDIFVKGKGENYLPDKIDDLYTEDLRLGADRKYKSKTDPQLEKDALDDGYWGVWRGVCSVQGTDVPHGFRERVVLCYCGNRLCVWHQLSVLPRLHRQGSCRYAYRKNVSSTREGWAWTTSWTVLMETS